MSPISNWMLYTLLLGAIGLLVFAIILNLMDSKKAILRKLNKIWYKLPGLRSQEVFKEYEDLFQNVIDGQIKAPKISINLQNRIFWLLRLSNSSAADIWNQDSDIKKGVLEIFEDLNNKLQKQKRDQKMNPKLRKLMQFKKEMNNW